MLELLAIQQALQLWLDIGGTNFSSFDGGFSGDGAGGNNYTYWFFCGEAAKKKNEILEQIVSRVKFGDSYQQGTCTFVLVSV